jgi:hypothetical protein
MDWGKRIVGIIGSLGNLVWASLLQNRGHIHHSGDGVGAVCEGKGGGSEAVYLVRGSVLSLWFLEPTMRQTRKTR